MGVINNHDFTRHHVVYCTTFSLYCTIIYRILHILSTSVAYECNLLRIVQLTDHYYRPRTICDILNQPSMVTLSSVSGILININLRNQLKHDNLSYYS
jgi:hypothetical protein